MWTANENLDVAWHVSGVTTLTNVRSTQSRSHCPHRIIKCDVTHRVQRENRVLPQASRCHSMTECLKAWGQGCRLRSFRLFLPFQHEEEVRGSVCIQARLFPVNMCFMNWSYAFYLELNPRVSQRKKRKINKLRNV